MIANNSTTETTLEIPLLKSLLVNTGVTVKNEVKKSLNDNTVIGFFCVVSSLIRKATTVSIIENLIADNNLPLVIEGANDSGKGFKVTFCTMAQPENKEEETQLLYHLHEQNEQEQYYYSQQQNF